MTTNQKVAGSSPAERAKESPAERDFFYVLRGPVTSIHQVNRAAEGFCSIGAHRGTRILTEHGMEAFVNEEGTRAPPWETARRALQAAAVNAYGSRGC